jgi:hypothetical protein
MQSDQIFELSKDKRKQEFSFDKSYSYISIKKVIVASLFGLNPNDWFAKLMQLNPYLKITCTKSSGEKLGYSMVIPNFVSPYHAQPVFEFQGDFIIPEQNKLNDSAFFSHFNNAIIELCYSDNEGADLKMTFIYQLTPGANAKP